MCGGGGGERGVGGVGRGWGCILLVIEPELNLELLNVTSKCYNYYRYSMCFVYYYNNIMSVFCACIGLWGKVVVSIINIYYYLHINHSTIFDLLLSSHQVV